MEFDYKFGFNLDILTPSTCSDHVSCMMYVFYDLGSL